MLCVAAAQSSRSDTWGGYVAEHSHRFNRGSRHVADRMGEAAATMASRSLTYRQITRSRG